MIDMRASLQEVLEAHGLAVVDDGAAVGVRGNPARIEARVTKENPYPQGTVVQLDVNTTLEGGIVINECCAGAGASRDEAAVDAVRNFSVYSLHVLLAAVWDQVESSQVVLETWEIGQSRWQAVLGNCAIKYKAPDTPTLPPDAFARFQTAISFERLHGTWNWFRWYYADNRVSPPMFESLKNNEPWVPGVEALRQASWPTVSNFWSARQFLILKRAN